MRVIFTNIFCEKIFIICCLFTFSCSSNEAIKEQICELKSTMINIPLGQMELIAGTYPPDVLTPYKLIVYADSTECSSCYSKKLYLWDKMINTYSSVSFIYIFDNLSNDDIDAINHLSIPTNMYVYLDKNRYFSSTNIHIPSNRDMHIFCLDSTNNVVAVGNPLKSLALKELYDSALKSVKKQINVR